MNKDELVSAVSMNVGISRQDAASACDTVFGAIKAALRAGDKVQIVGFGTFEVKVRASRMGRNPKTGEKVYVPSRKVPAFKPGKPLKDAVAQ